MPITCTASGIAEAAACFQNPCINDQDRMAIAVYLRALQLLDAGGTDYTSDFDALIADSVGLLIIGHNTVNAEDLALLLDGTAGAPTDVGELLAIVACLRCQPLEVLRQALQFLQCEINAALA